MRKILPILSVACAIAAATPALAQSVRDSNYEPGNYAAPVVGAAAGTAVGVGAYNGWYTSSAFATSLGATTAGAVVAGGVAGVGAAAVVDAALQPCRGFHAMFTLNQNECVNGQWVGNQPERQIRRMR